MNGRRLAKTLVLLSALAGLAATAACDGGIQLRGRVYEQRRPGSQSRAFIDRTPDEDLSGLTPLSGAKVTLYHGTNFDKEALDPSKGFTREAVTNTSGEFDIFDTTAPYKFRAALVIEKPGYKPVTEIFQHGESAHTAVVILVPDTQP